MPSDRNRVIVVTGATGLQGGAVVRHLLLNSWQHVRALTRSPSSEKARILASLGAEVVQGNMADPASLGAVFEGVYGVYSVQNPMLSGVEGEISQGRHVAEAARRADVGHVVYGSTGTGLKGTGIPSWESKLVVEEYMKSLGLPLTILRPRAFMELMTDKKFFPPVSTWHVMPALMGSATKLGWISASDLGFIAAKVFADPEQFIGQELPLASDIKSIDECRALYRAIMGRSPPWFPMPVWLFERFGFVGRDLSCMWRWLRNGRIDWEPERTRSIHPAALDVQGWLAQQKNVGAL